MQYVAVVYADREGKRRNKDWACFLGDTKKEAVDKAMDVLAVWGRHDYRVSAGPLDSNVIFTDDCAFHEYKIEDVT